MIRFFSLTFAGVATALALASCASVSVQPGTESAATGMPARIYVAYFDTSHAEFKVDREGAELDTFKHDIQAMLQAAMVTDLSKRLVPAVAAPASGMVPRENAWLIRGEFTRVNQGSRLLRTAVGFGAGGTKMETKVYVYDLARDPNTPFLTFGTTGGSNAEPGAVTAIATDPVTIAVEAAAGGAGGLAHGLTEDSRRTGREITAELSDFMYRAGWISADKWIKPKNESQ